MSAQAKPALSSSATIREVRLQDYAQIAALLARNDMSHKRREEWEHLWVNNPVYKNLAAWTMGWVAEDTEQEIVGYIGNIPLSFQYKGREIIGASIHALMTDLAHRSRGGFLLRRLLNYKVPHLMFTTTANAYSSKLSGPFRTPRVPTGDWSRSAFWITNYHGFLASALKNKGLPKVLSYPASAALRLKDTLTNANSWARKSRPRIETCSGFDERFTQFWESLKQAYPQRLLATRSREVLQWHFKYALEQKTVWIVTAEDASRLVAYAIFCRQDNPENDLKRVRLVDFQALSGDTEILTAMLASGLTRCQKEGIHMLEAFGFRPEKQRVIDSLAPYRRQLPSWWYFYKPMDKALAPDLQDPAIWDPSHFDGDATL